MFDTPNIKFIQQNRIKKIICPILCVALTNDFMILFKIK